ncbi:MAG: hypothetical protein M0P99_08215 [Candidatus Cloacimonetes bacterium]|nr:hypothetical protein [Candidatus Cloacimonadota bacterium]
MATIPFDKDVVATMNVGANVGVNVVLDKIEKLILEKILKFTILNAVKLSFLIDKSKRTAERYLKSLKERGYIIREGSDKKGVWRVLK